LVRKGEDYLYATCGWVFAFFFHKWVRTEYVFYGDNLPNESENVILLSNHQCSVDWLILEFLTLRANAAGFTRYILKDVLRLVPVYGFMINRHGGIFVRRKGGRDKDNIHNALQKIADDKRPVCVCVCVCLLVHSEPL
jgi:1-acyl-sn-glycerol-3-phosphate acyltransferase